MLDFRTETFLTVCEYMNYTKAAEVLGLTQPAISGHIKFLENYYNIKLFTYANKKLTLTKQGEVLKQALQTQIHDEIRLKRNLTQIKEKRVYRIGATLSIADSYLPRFLPYYIENNKDVELSVTVANTATLIKMLDKGGLDIVLSEGYFSKDKYESRLITKEELAIFCGKNYDISDIHSIEDLFHHRFISREPGSGTRAVFEHYLLDRGYSIEDFESRCEFTSLELITEMLMANQGISVIYRCVGTKLLSQGELKEIKISEFALSHDFNAIWQKNSMYGNDNEVFLEALSVWQKNRD